MTPVDLRTALATLLATYLGRFTDIEGRDRGPAIRVGEPDSDWLASGLECNIQPTPDMEPVRQFTRDALTKHWRVRLIQHDPGSLEEPLRLVLKTYRNTPTPTILGPTGDLPEQATLLIPDPDTL